MFKLTGPGLRELDDQVADGSRSFRVGSSRSVTAVLSSMGSRAAGVGALGAGNSSRLAVAGRDWPRARSDFSWVIGESFFATIVGARVGRVRGALGILVVSGRLCSGAGGDGKRDTGIFSCWGPLN